MIEYSFVVHPGVDDEFDAVVAYYRQFGDEVAARFVRAYDGAIERIETYPLSGRTIFDVYRRVTLRRVPIHGPVRGC